MGADMASYAEWQDQSETTVHVQKIHQSTKMVQRFFKDFYLEFDRFTKFEKFSDKIILGVLIKMQWLFL